ncbi:MAG: hypothetical protein N2516_06320 [Dictyoglomaceae bacterium]|nr:hypothetical protein [Dictyoglomaceae bacterium]
MRRDFNYEERKKSILTNIKENKLNLEEIRNLIEDYKKTGLDIQKLIEYAIKSAEGKTKEELEKLYDSFFKQNVSFLCDKLATYGYALRGREVYERFYNKEKNTPEGVVYRILELTRLGKREEVFHILLREFISAKEEISSYLTEAFNTKYSLDSFKVLIYSFLSGLLGQYKGGIDNE